jgi:hypothetical protein
MNSLDKFRTRIDAKQTELILRKLVKKQEDGEIRNDDELRAALSEMLKAVANAGFITLEIPVKPWEKIESERFQAFFDSLGMDIETLFVEVDHTEDVLSGLTQNVVTQLRNLSFALGNLRSEVVARRLRRTPGSGWSTILRDSFDSGYGKLLGRAELSVDLFYDDRTGYSQDNENVPIKSDARIQGIAKKLTLPETGNNVIGFKRSRLLWEAGTTQSNIPVDNTIETYRMIDGQSDTFWSYIVGSEYPFLGTPESEIVQIAGTELSGNSIGINLSGLKDPQAHEYYIRIVGFSGTIPQYVCLASPEDFAGPTCSFDLGNRCQWNYTNQYSTNCANRNCSRYSPDLPVLSGFRGILDDGFGYDTGAIINFNSLSGIYAGQTWRVGITPSGIQGAQICLELTLTKSTKINWIEIDPVTTSPVSIVSVEYTRQGDTTRQSIIDSSVQVLDRIRLDFAAIEADKIFLTVRQETYEQSDLHLRPEQQAIKKIDSFITRVNAPSIEEFYDVELESLLTHYLPNGPLRRSVEKISVKPQEVKGNFYAFGLFEVNCGLTSHADTAIAVAKEQRVLTPRMFGVQSNLEPDITYASGLQPGQNGTIEFSAVKFNYDKNNTLINIDDFPIPLLASDGTITERFFVDGAGQGYLRFAAKSISEIYIVNENLNTSDYSSENLNTPLLKTQVTITDPVITEDSILLVTYVPQFGVFLNEGKTLSIEDNSDMTLSISEVPALVVAAAKTSNRKIQYADVFLRMILRRNDLDIYGSPGLRDYQFLIGESDEGRFF